MILSIYGGEGSEKAVLRLLLQSLSLYEASAAAAAAAVGTHEMNLEGCVWAGIKAAPIINALDSRRRKIFFCPTKDFFVRYFLPSAFFSALF